MGAVCIWRFILLEVGASDLQKTCQQTRGAGLACNLILLLWLKLLLWQHLLLVSSLTVSDSF